MAEPDQTDAPPQVPPPEPPPPSRHGRPRRLATRVALTIGAVALAALIVLALSRIGFSRIGNSLSSVNFAWLAGALAIDAISLAMRGVSWQGVLRAALPRIHVGIGHVISATMVGVLGSAVMPGRIGEPARAYLIARRGGSVRRLFSVVLGTVFSQTVINILALLILAAITLTSVALFRGREAVLAVVIVAPLAIALVTLAVPRLLIRATRSRFRRLRAAATFVRQELILVRRGLTVFRDFRHGAWATIAQLVAWALQTLACYAVILALHLDAQANLQAAAAVLLAVNVTAAVPVTPSNLGVFQAACVAVLALYGVGAGPALAYGILLQAVEVATAILLGVPALFAEGLSWKEIRRVGQAIEHPPDIGA